MLKYRYRAASFLTPLLRSVRDVGQPPLTYREGAMLNTPGSPIFRDSCLPRSPNMPINRQPKKTANRISGILPTVRTPHKPLYTMRSNTIVYEMRRCRTEIMATQPTEYKNRSTRIPSGKLTKSAAMRMQRNRYGAMQKQGMTIAEMCHAMSDAELRRNAKQGGMAAITEEAFRAELYVAPHPEIDIGV